LPSVDLTPLQGGARSVIEPALRDAQAKPDRAEAAARLAMALHAHNQFAAAERAYARAEHLRPDHADYAYLRGVVLASDGKYADALPSLRRALSLQPASIPIRLRLADTLYAAGQWDAARTEYRALVTSDPALAAAHYGLARTLTGDEAIHELQQASALFPRYGAARFALAGLYRKQGKSKEAEAALANYERDRLEAPAIADPAMEAVYALDASGTGLLRRAQALERQGRLEEAAALHEQAVNAEPAMVQAWINMISLYGRLGAGEKAEAAYRKAFALDANSAEAHYNFGVLCAQLDRLQEAEKAFAEAVRLDPLHAEALDNLGAMVERSGAWARAAGLYRRAIAAKPGLQIAHYHLGRIYANQRRYADAIAELEKATVILDDQAIGYLYALGAVHARAGHREEAVRILRQARDEASRRSQTQLAEMVDRDLRKLTNF
jgi:tetratricopeptide (TPR) repeat protein